MKRPGPGLSRRQFIQRGARSAGICVLGTAALTAQRNLCRAAGGDSSANPFAYNLEGLGAIDPKWVKFEQVRVLSTLCPGPRRLAVDSRDQLYVATRKGIQVWDGMGNAAAEIALNSPARCVAVAGDGTVYAGTRTQIEVFDSKGKPVATWEPPTKKTWFTGLSVGANDLFAADSANRVVFRYDRSGKVIGRIGEKNPERNIPGLIVPSPYLDVKLGHDGLLRINNPGRHRVEVFTTGGDLELSWGKPSASIAGFCGCCNPIGLAMLPGGLCLTCEKGIPRVKIYSTDHNLDCVVAGPDLFRQSGPIGRENDDSEGNLGGIDAAVDSKGTVYILDLIAGDIRVMRPKA